MLGMGEMWSFMVMFLLLSDVVYNIQGLECWSWDFMVMGPLLCDAVYNIQDLECWGWVKCGVSCSWLII